MEHSFPTPELLSAGSVRSSTVSRAWARGGAAATVPLPNRRFLSFDISKLQASFSDFHWNLVPKQKQAYGVYGTPTLFGLETWLRVA